MRADTLQLIIYSDVIRIRKSTVVRAVSIVGKDVSWVGGLTNTNTLKDIITRFEKVYKKKAVIHVEEAVYTERFKSTQFTFNKTKSTRYFEKALSESRVRLHKLIEKLHSMHAENVSAQKTVKTSNILDQDVFSNKDKVLCWKEVVTYDNTLVIATDASVSKETYAASAWVAENGRGSVEVVKGRTSSNAEKSALIMALKEIPPHVKLTVYMDALNVVDTVIRIQNGEVKKKDKLLRSLLINRDVNVVWVKAHNNHPLNSLVDQLSRAAARSAAKNDLIHLQEYCIRRQLTFPELTAS